MERWGSLTRPLKLSGSCDLLVTNKVYRSVKVMQLLPISYNLGARGRNPDTLRLAARLGGSQATWRGPMQVFWPMVMAQVPDK